MNLELYINDDLIEIDESVITPLTYTIADVKDPAKRSRSRSKTIRVKGTQNNRVKLSSAYNLSLTSSGGVGFDFNPNSESTAYIVRNGVRIFEGVALLLDVEIKDKVIYFNLQIFTTSIGLFEQLGKMKIGDLGWSEYTHSLTVSNLELSWDTSVVKNGTPTSNFTGGVPDGFGYLYGLVNYGYSTDQLKVKTNELIPLFYAKEIMEKIYSLGGYTITGSFINSDRFKRLTVGLGGGEQINISDAEASDRLVDYTVDASTVGDVINGVNTTSNVVRYDSYKTYVISDIAPFTTTLVNDNNTQFDESTGELLVLDSGYYNIECSLTIDYLSVILSDIGTNQYFATSLLLRILVNGSVVKIASTSLQDYPRTTSVTAQIDRFLNSNDLVQFELIVNHKGQQNTTAVGSTATYNWDVTAGNLTMTSINKTLEEGDDVEIGRFAPDITCKDFVNDMITMFNLYVSEPNELNEVEIETFADYYEGTNTAENWITKLDISQTQKISTSAGIEGRNYLYKFAEDNDLYKQLYFNEFGENYGDYNHTIPTSFKKGEKKYELKFAQTVPIDVDGLAVPQIVKLDDNTGLIKPYKGKPRIYLYNGLVSGNWELKNSTTGATTNETSYPQMSHVDNTANPTFDLNFGIPKKIYYNTSNYTTNNLYLSYWDVFNRELTNVDSKFYEAYFNLNEKDIHGDFLKKLVNIDGVIFRKNKIVDFDATGYNTTKVELIKVLDAKTKTGRVISVPSEVVSQLGKVVEKSTDFTPEEKVELYNVDTSGGDVTVTLPDQTYIAQEWNIKKTTKEGKVIINVEGGGLIDEDESKYIKSLSSARLKFNGTNYNLI